MNTILVVDDDLDLTDALASLLGGMGFDVDVAHSGAEAMERVRTRMPRLIISDVRMPNGNGIQLFRELRAFPGGAEVPFAFLSGFVSDRDDDLAEIRRDPVGFRFFTKPIDMEAFMEFLRRFHNGAER